MTTVFIGGSRHVTRLNDQFLKRLDNILAKNFPILIGDANGADKAIQQFLYDNNYHNVEVFCSGGICRNNLGHWQTRNISTNTIERNAQFYAVKDRVMAQEATLGLMLWDGKSTGTLLNVYRLLKQRKRVVIYVVPEKYFLDLKSESEWDGFMLGLDIMLRQKFKQKAKLEVSTLVHPIQTSFFDEKPNSSQKVHS